jgi:hypothetical protein
LGRPISRIFKGEESKSFKIGLIGFLRMLVKNYLYMLHNFPEEHRSQMLSWPLTAIALKKMVGYVSTIVFTCLPQFTLEVCFRLTSYTWASTGHVSVLQENACSVEDEFFQLLLISLPSGLCLSDFTIASQCVLQVMTITLYIISL